MVTQPVTNNKMQGKSPSMLAWALAYARIGFHVFPCHVPLFDHPLGYVCTCEEWRHSDHCKQTRPDLYLDADKHCDNPGKHSWGIKSWLEEATTDEVTIRFWWKKHPNANIAHIPGRANMVMLDGDTYKDGFEDVAGLSFAERATLTAISGRGGEHLYYRKWDGATYTNAAGELSKHKRDVRGDNGFALLPPSVGLVQRYAWEDGFGPRDVEPQLLPERIHKMLSEASAKAGRRSTLGHRNRTVETTTPEPDLNAWAIGRRTVESITSPAARGSRSEVDMKVCIALAGAGMSDEDILAVFEHFPIGVNGKFAERGIDYLDRTIGAAREYVESHPRQKEEVREPDANFLGKVNALRMWNRTTRFSEVEPTLLRTKKDGSKVYTTDANDTKVFDALCDFWEETGGFTTKPVGKKLLGKKAGCSPNSAKSALERLSSFLVTVAADEDGFGFRITLNECRLTGFDPSPYIYLVNMGVNSGQTTATNDCYLDDNEYSPRKTHDVYQSGTSRYVRDQMKFAKAGEYWAKPVVERADPKEAMWESVAGMTPEEWEAHRDEFMAKMDELDRIKPKKTPEQKKWDKERRGLGETSLRVLDALNRCGDMTAQEIAAETSKSIHSVRDALSRMSNLMPDLVHSERDGSRGPKVWVLEPEAFDEAEAIVVGMKTYKMALGREERRLEQAINWTMHRQEQAENPEEFKKAERRIEKLKNERISVVKDLYELPDAMAMEYADYVGHSDFEMHLEMAREERMEQYDLDVFMGTVDERAEEVAESLKGMYRSEAAAKLSFAGYSEVESRAILDKFVESGVLTPGAPAPKRLTDDEYMHRKVVAMGKAAAEADWKRLNEKATEEFGSGWWIGTDTIGTIEKLSPFMKVQEESWQE